VLRLPLWRILAYSHSNIKLLSFDHHRIPILINPINDELEAFDHLIVVPGLARLCQHTGVTPRLSNRAHPQDTADNSNMELNSWPHVRSNYPQTNFRRLQLILLSVNLFYHLHYTPLHYRFRVDGRLINARIQQDPLSIRSIFTTHFFPQCRVALSRLHSKNRRRPNCFTALADSIALQSFWHLNPSVICPLTADWWSTCLLWLGICLCTFRLAFTPLATASPSARDKVI